MVTISIKVYILILSKLIKTTECEIQQDYKLCQFLLKTRLQFGNKR